MFRKKNVICSNSNYFYYVHVHFCMSFWDSPIGISPEARYEDNLVLAHVWFVLYEVGYAILCEYFIS